VVFPRELQVEKLVVISPAEAYRVVKGMALLLMSGISKGTTGKV
jgi:hypothetical protein